MGLVIEASGSPATRAFTAGLIDRWLASAWAIDDEFLPLTWTDGRLLRTGDVEIGRPNPWLVYEVPLSAETANLHLAACAADLADTGLGAFAFMAMQIAGTFQRPLPADLSRWIGERAAKWLDAGDMGLEYAFQAKGAGGVVAATRALAYRERAVQLHPAYVLECMQVLRDPGRLRWDMFSTNEALELAYRRAHPDGIELEAWRTWLERYTEHRLRFFWRINARDALAVAYFPACASGDAAALEFLRTFQAGALRPGTERKLERVIGELADRVAADRRDPVESAPDDRPA